MILNMSGGGSNPLNFKVVGQPETPASTSRNLIVYPFYQTTLTNNGVTFTDNGDGTVTANGTATALARFRPAHEYTPGLLWLEPGTYTASGCPSGGSEDGYRFEVWDHVNNIGLAYDIGNSKTFTLAEGTYVRFSILIASGLTVSDQVWRPQLEKGSTATEFVKYAQKENLIWVDTDVDIPSWAFSATGPQFLILKDMLEGVTFVSGYLKNGVITTPGTSAADLCTNNYISVAYGKTYQYTYNLASSNSMCLLISEYDSSQAVLTTTTKNDGVTTGYESGIYTPSSANVAFVRISYRTWKNSAAAITFAEVEPVEGMVWIAPGTSYDAQFNALKKNELDVYLGTVKQYISGKWVALDAYIYKDGEWVQFSSVQYLIFADGEFHNGITFTANGNIRWTTDYAGITPSQSVSNSIWKMSMASEPGYSGCVISTAKIDFTYINRLITHVVSGTSENNPDTYRGLHVGLYEKNNSQLVSNSVARVVEYYPISNEDVVLDTSKISGSYYLAFFIHAWNNAIKVSISDVYGE